ncbi:hypothetical protein TUSST3_94160 [Streptomyces sp. TUS-ST3]|nr:hypothetical protein TUSST3_94160 [Streptomyces sp. TUS-ST3]
MDGALAAQDREEEIGEEIGGAGLGDGLEGRWAARGLGWDDRGVCGGGAAAGG